MFRRRATLILVAVLALVDLVGLVMLRDAWSARHDKAATSGSASTRPSPASASTAADTTGQGSGT